nr:hypothetical protein [Tanacetum cinerariifolium]
MARLAFCDYHNMIAILEKYEHNQDFHQIVDFVEASHIRYALTFNPTVYVSYIRQFRSTARIKTTKEGTKILATVDGNLKTISKSSIRRNLKLNDKEGISSLPDAKLFENLTLMGYNISPNQKFTFQKGQFSHQWKYLIHTIMQCLGPKSTGFNKFSSNIATTLVCLATNRVYNFSKMIFDGMVRNINNKVSKFLMYPRFLSICLRMGQFGQITHTHTYVVPFHTRKFFTTLRVNSPSFLGRTVPLFDSMLVPQGEGSRTPTEPHHTPTSEASQSSQHELPSPSLPPVPTESLPIVIPSDNPLSGNTPGGLGLLNQDRANIAKTSTLPSDSTPRVTSFAADEGTRELEIINLKARVRLLEDREGGGIAHSRDDAPMKGRKQLKDGEVQVVPTAAEASTATVSIPTGSGVVSTASPNISTAAPIFTTATVSTTYTRRKGKETVVESETPKKKKVQEQIDVQLARELEEEMDSDAQRMNEQIARDAEIARIHAEEELQMLIDGLDMNNETIAKYLQEYYQFATELPIERRIEFITFRQRRFEPVMGISKRNLSIRPVTSDKEMEIWVVLKRLYEPDVEDQLWTHTQNLMHAPVEWKLYDTCGVHHVTSKDKEIFMLVEKDYPLRKGLAIRMISYKLQVENYAQMANDLILKIYKIASSPRQQDY